MKTAQYIGKLVWLDYPNTPGVNVIRKQKRGGKSGYLCQYDGAATCWFPEVGTCDRYEFRASATEA
jgi:hypothetical protein